MSIEINETSFKSIAKNLHKILTEKHPELSLTLSSVQQDLAKACKYKDLHELQAVWKSQNVPSAPSSLEAEKEPPQIASQLSFTSLSKYLKNLPQDAQDAFLNRFNAVDNDLQKCIRSMSDDTVEGLGELYESFERACKDFGLNSVFSKKDLARFESLCEIQEMSIRVCIHEVQARSTPPQNNKSTANWLDGLLDNLVELTELTQSSETIFEGFERYKKEGKSLKLGEKMALNWSLIQEDVLNYEKEALELVDLLSEPQGMDYIRFIASHSEKYEAFCLNTLAEFIETNPKPLKLRPNYEVWFTEFEELCQNLVDNRPSNLTKKNKPV